MTNNIDVSCVIPVKNGGAYLVECLHSVLEQNFRGTYDICAYDDGSTDDTWSTLMRYKGLFNAKGINFHARRGATSGGVGFAKNRACEQSTARFICFCDADDVNHAERLQASFDAAMKLSSANHAFIGSQCTRLPEGSTDRFVRWANEMTETSLYEQIFTANGPTLLTPTWFIARELFKKSGGFNENHLKGYPEDLRIFFKAIDAGAILHKVARPLVMYRYHSGCQTFCVSEKTIWQIRIAELEQRKLSGWKKFSIWSAGKQGKRLYKSLTEESKAKVSAFYDVDQRKIERGVHEEYDEKTRSVKARIPIFSIRSAAQLPLVICVKQDLTGGDLERFIEDKKLREGVDYVHFG